MSACRFMYQNQIAEADSLTVSSAKAGVVGMPAPQTSGSAVAYSYGEYSGETDQLFLLEIDSLDAGSQVGQASFRWRRSLSQTWEGVGITTSDSLISLADGVSVKWTSGPGDDFALGDVWTILAARNFGKASLLDRDRDTIWQALDCQDEYITVDLGQTQEISTVILADHNLSSGASVTLMADDSGDWESPAFSQQLTITSPHLCAFVSQNRRYFRLRLQDPANPDGALSASLLYLGGYFEPSRNFGAGYTRTTVAGRSLTATDAGKLAGGATGLGENWGLSFRGLNQTDVDYLSQMHQAVHNGSSGKISPIFFTPFPDSPQSTLYCLPPANLSRVQIYQGRHALDMSLEEVVRTNV